MKEPTLAQLAARAGIATRTYTARVAAWRDLGKVDAEARVLALKSGPPPVVHPKATEGRKAAPPEERGPDFSRPTSSPHVRNTGKAPTKPGEVYRGQERARRSQVAREAEAPLDPSFIPAFIADRSLLPKRPPSQRRPPEPVETETWDPAGQP